LKIAQNLATVKLWITAHILAQAAVNKSEVILQVGAEGGAITLYGVRDPDGWRYSVLDQTPSLLPDEFDEPEIRKRF
jgi:precorrin-6B methylase 2